MEAFIFLIIPRDRTRIDEIFNLRVCCSSFVPFRGAEVSRVVKMAKANDRQRGCSEINYSSVGSRLVIYRHAKRMKSAQGFLDRLKADRAVLLLLVSCEARVTVTCCRF